jgi:hypothetical protein
MDFKGIPSLKKRWNPLSLIPDFSERVTRSHPFTRQSLELPSTACGAQGARLSLPTSVSMDFKGIPSLKKRWNPLSLNPDFSEQVTPSLPLTRQRLVIPSTACGTQGAALESSDFCFHGFQMDSIFEKEMESIISDPSYFFFIPFSSFP